MGETLNAGLDLQTVIQRTLEEVRKLIDATSCSVMMLDESGGFLETVGGMGGDQGGIKLRVGEGIAGCVAASGIPEIVNDVMKDPRFLNKESTLKSLICAPLKVKDKVFGVINLGNSTSVTYASEDLKLFNAFVTQAAVAIENARLNEARMKQEVAKTKLQRYLSPHLVDMVMDDSLSTSLHSSRQNIAVFFSDIRNFTQLSEDLDPETLVNHLNEYFTEMVEIIFEHGGTLNKFVGDMIVALYGAPSQTDDNEARAIETAIGMQRAIRDRQWSWINREFGVGVGINSADVVVGNIGSPQHMDYTAIGDGVNVASRLQAIALPGQIMVSRSVFDKTRDRYEFKRWGNVALKGKSKPVEVFEVLY
jgi:adenylate cyclase